jgi:hypothetical protein
MRLLLIIPNSEDATSWYRGVKPFNKISKDYKINVKTIHPRDLTWCEVDWADIVFFQRPNGPNHLGMVKMIKSMEKKLVLDYDDNHYDVQLESSHYNVFKDTRQDQTEIMNLADMIFVSTRALKEALAKYTGTPIEVIENGVEINFNPDLNFRENSIYYRGSNTHIKDVMVFARQIGEAIEKRPERFTFQGLMPWYLQTTKTFNYLEPDYIPVYFNQLKNSFHDLFIVPLNLNNFNFCKSNIAALEAAICGANVICPNWPEWQLEGALKYNNPQEFGELLMNFTYSKESVIAMRHDIAKRYNLKDKNSQRVDMLDDLYFNN